MHLSAETILLDRRAVFATLVAAVAARSARGQILTDASDAQLLFGDLEHLLLRCIDAASGEIAFSLQDLVAAELDSRRSLSNTLIERKLNDSDELLRAVIEIAPSYVGEGNDFQLPQIGVESQLALLDEMRAQGFQPVPSATEMVTANITSLPEAPFPEEEIDSDLLVAFDILVDAMGIGLNPQDIIIAVIESDPKWEDQMKELVKIISTRDWREVVNAIQIIVLAIISPAVWAIIKRMLASGGRRALYALGLRLLPIVGPGYIAAVFLISLKQNWSRFSFA